MDFHMYEAQADTIDVNNIATGNSENRIVLSRIKRNNEDDCVKQLYIQRFATIYSEHECEAYIPEGDYDMGWLGYFVGKNDYLEELHITSFPNTTSMIGTFLRGVNNNKSIHTLNIRGGVDLLGGKVFTVLGPFFKKNQNLKYIDVDAWGDIFGIEVRRALALAIGSSISKSLTDVSLKVNNNIFDGGMVDIITTLSMHPHIENLSLVGTRLCMSTNGCMALATLLQSVTQLQSLDLGDNGLGLSGNKIDDVDEGILALVPALKSCSHLEILRLDYNTFITAKGWQHLASILEAPNSSLTTLSIQSNFINDEALAFFTNALINNETLVKLNLNGNQVTSKGREPFIKLLCDTSSVNSTFVSNHTLNSIGSFVVNTDQINTIASLLHLNGKVVDNKKQVAMIKILQHHNEFDMSPFYGWEFKVLPLMIDWFERTLPITSIPDIGIYFEPNIEPRKLSCIYQFVRDMPVIYVETRLGKELEDINAELSQLEGGQRKQHLKERKRRILEQLRRS